MLFLLKNIKKIILSFLLPYLLFSSYLTYAVEVPIYDFPLDAYPQDVNGFLPPYSEDYSTSLLPVEYQKARLADFYHHYYSTETNSLSPWNEKIIEIILPAIKYSLMRDLAHYENQTRPESNIHFAENHKPHDANWIPNIRTNMNLPSLDSARFTEKNRAIAITNILVRTLPDNAPDFFHFSIAGEGFPFDNLQIASAWAGTPLYVLNVSKDKAWALVLTPDAYFGWVKRSDIAYASPKFIKQWQSAAKKGLAGITQTGSSILDAHQNFQFTGYIGSVFPLYEENEKTLSILIPAKNERNQAIIKTSTLSKETASRMPLVASKKNFAKLLKELQNRPYGWGGAFFYNDCSQELKSLFAPFGIWLPRNSAQQAQLKPNLDLSEENLDDRLMFLRTKGSPLMTIIYLERHVMLLVGHQAYDNQELTPITYQNVWGLAPDSKDKRYVIGKSLFFPLLKMYPEVPDATSLADKKMFKLIFLDEMSNELEQPEAFVRRFFPVKK